MNIYLPRNQKKCIKLTLFKFYLKYIYLNIQRSCTFFVFLNLFDFTQTFLLNLSLSVVINYYYSILKMENNLKKYVY